MSRSSLPIVDTDTHLTEPPDLWTSRVAARYAARAPRVERHPETGQERWRLGDRWLSAVSGFSRTAGTQDEKTFPSSWDEVDPACYDAAARAVWMDKLGIAAQVVYPNFVAFEGFALMALSDEALKVELVRIYNEYLVDFARDHRDRFVLLASLPFWNREESIKELTRCKDLGFQGALWAATLDRHGLPTFQDPYWDPFYAVAQDLEMSINFHVGVGYTEEDTNTAVHHDGKAFDPADTTYRTAIGFQSNARTMAKLVLFGVCDRFPNLDFVSVESGFGFVPFLIESLDWQWLHNRGREHFPSRLLPSEYFRRQIYSMFWYENTTLAQLPDYADNVMFETDFPHNTCLVPDSTVSPEPRQLTDAHVARFGEDIMAKVLYKNAARVYGLDEDVLRASVR